MHHQPRFLQCSCLFCVLCCKQALSLFLHSTKRQQRPPRKLKPCCPGTASPEPPVIVLYMLSGKVHSKQSTRSMALTYLQGKFSRHKGITQMQRDNIFVSDAHLPTAHVGSYNSP